MLIPGGGGMPPIGACIMPYPIIPGGGGGRLPIIIPGGGGGITPIPPPSAVGVDVGPAENNVCGRTVFGRSIDCANNLSACDP